MKINKQLIIILFFYYVFAFFTMFYWIKSDWNNVDGDEPHYLIMASGFVKNLSFEQTAPYIEEFKTRKIFKKGLAAANAVPSRNNTHAAFGPHGLYNLHNIGLPILISIPYLIGGTVAVKSFMILLSGVILLIVWKTAYLFTKNKSLSNLISISLCFALPFFPASNQIYPDLIAGLICLISLYILISSDNKTPIKNFILPAFIISFLPWLQIKNMAPALVLLGAFIYYLFWKRKCRNLKIYLLFLLTFFLSILLLGLYNNLAYGNYFGPYGEGALLVNRAALMTLIGLHIDQNQGFFIQNPIYIIAIPYIFSFIKKYKETAIIILILYASFLVPNGLHPNWYGGASFSGRFNWSALVVFLIPTIYGLYELRKTNKKLFTTILALSFLLQSFLYYKYTFGLAYLLNRGSIIMVEDYSIYYRNIAEFLPSFYNVHWCFQYSVNIIYIVFFVILFLLNFVKSNKKIKTTIIVSLILIIILIPMRIFGEPSNKYLVWNANILPSNTGKIEGTERIAKAKEDIAGYIIYGPDTIIYEDNYEVQLNYKSDANNDEQIGLYEIFNFTNMEIEKTIDIYGTNGEEVSLVLDFTIEKQKTPDIYEFRVFWNGKDDIDIKYVQLNKK